MFDFAAHGLIESRPQLPLPGGGPDTIGAVLDRQLASNPDRLALVGRSGRFTYAELDRAVNRTAAVLIDIGIGRYDRVAACLPNDVDIVIAMLACARVGGIWVGINRVLAAPEKAYLLRDSGAALYIADQQDCREFEVQRSSQLLGLNCMTAASLRDRSAVMSSSADCRIEVSAFEPAAIAYTSGTTGRPKGAVHSHHNILLPGAIQVVEGNFGPDCHQGVMLPLTILNLMVLAPMTAFQDGSACVCMDSMQPADIAYWIKHERVGHFASVPTVIQDLLTSERVDPADLDSLGCPDIGGAGIAQSFQELYRTRFGRSLTVAYGMTEAPTIVCKTDPGRDPQEELCGRAVPQVDIVVVDADDKPVDAGEEGEVCVRPATTGPYAGIYTTMLGYWGRAEATREALANGMYHTADLGVLDDDGQLYIRGRKKELIIRGGANVYPAEVERVLNTHPAVADAAVLGVADERLGQCVVAVVECAGGTAPEDLEARLQAYCSEAIARYKVPAHIQVVPALPRNAMNKVIKAELEPLFQ